MSYPANRLPMVAQLADQSDLDKRLFSSAIAPAYSNQNTYAVGERVTRKGLVFKCISAITTPEEFIAAHWDVVDVFSTDASLDIGENGELKVVAEDGTNIWVQGYNLETESITAIGSKIRLSNETVNRYAFSPLSADVVTIEFQKIEPDKAGDVFLDVTGPVLPDFSVSATYAQGDYVVYSGEVWQCSVAVTTAGSWTGTTNWTKTVAAYDSSSTYGVGDKAVSGGKVWQCTTANTTGNWDDSKWKCASFTFGPAWPTDFNVVVDAGENLTAMFTVEPNDLCELHFAMTTYQLDGKTTWKTERKDVENAYVPA